jgi:hypothetical protein
LSCSLLCGCATYKVQNNKADKGGGFVVTRYNKIVPEYTVGEGNTFPHESLAKERFKRRRTQVEYYYKKMGFMENSFKQDFVDPPLMLLGFVGGIFRMPFIAVSDYRYNHNPKYKEKMDKLEDARYSAEKARINKIKEELSAYIKEDLSKEASLVAAPAQAPAVKVEPPQPAVAEIPAPVPVQPAAVEAAKPQVQEKAIAVQEELKSAAVDKELENKATETPRQPATSLPKAVIMAKPLSGSSPLKVSFSGVKSSSTDAKITAYSWDFGDGDKSNKPNPVNTYWSTTYGTREFVATLTVTDNKGKFSSSSTTIRVINN